MRVRALHAKWLLVTVIMVMGVLLALSLFVASAFASGTSDSTSPWVIKIDPKDINEPDTVDVDADYQDLGTGIEVSEVTLDVPDAVVSGCTKTSSHVHCKATKLAHGDHDAIVSVKDKSGNTGSSSKKFRYDKVAPVISNITASNSAVTVKYTDPAPSSGIASVVVTVDGNILNCRATGTGCDDDHDGYDHDHDGYDGDNDAYDDDHDGYDDDHDGSDVDHRGYYDDSNGNHHDSDGYFHDSDDDHDGSSSSGYTCPILGNLGCGTHQVVVTITDKAGNVTTGNAVIDNGVCDLVPPTTTDNAPTGWQNADVTVALTCTDNAGGSGCATTTYEVDGGATQTGNSVSLTTDGVHTITYRSTDNAGNVETTKTATVMIDKTPPVVTTSGNVTVEATGPSGAAASFTSSATDALSGAGAVSCSPASGSTFPLGPSTTVTCSATDVAGNTGTATLTVTVQDTTDPVVTTSGNVTVEATGPSGAAVDFTSSATDIVDGTDLTSCSPASGSTFPLGPSTTVTCSATDVAGNTGTATLTVTVQDTTDPVVTYTGPIDTIYTSESPTITGTATDAVGVVSASAIIVGDPTIIACTVDAGIVSCPTSGVGYGPHTVVITATDAAGNTGSATSIFCKSSGRPNLMLYKVRGPYVVAGDPYRWVTVDYRMDNSGPNAYNVKMLSMTANNGIYLTSPVPPPTLGNIAPGGSVSFSVKYYYPVGVTSYIFTNTACAEDQCFTEYLYP